MVLGLATLVCVGAVFVLSKGTQFLMPGPLASAHGAIENCSACHTRSGKGKMSWLHGLVAGHPLADSKACLSCHKMPATAFNAHGASAEVLKASTTRLKKIAAQTPQPQSARAQSAAFPTHDMVARGLYCATCHQEHQGASFNLNKISNEQCRSCHVVKFDSFDGDHPKFDSYPFKRRTRIIYDHAGHFGKHYPEVAKKDSARRIPENCSTCHNTREDKRVMAVAPFEQTCSTCHLDQIIGKERVTGPKGIAFLSLPGLDLETLQKRSAPFGEWPDASDAALTPFMKMMIARDTKGRALLKSVDGLNLQDLSAASDEQIRAVADLAWEIKGLFYALIKGKASDVLGNFDIGGGAKLSASLVADLTASIPRDVVASAQQQWLPNLATEMANGRDKLDRPPSGSAALNTPPTSEKSPPQKLEDGPEEAPAATPQTPDTKAASVPKRDPPPCMLHVFGQCLISNDSPTASGGDDAPTVKDGGEKEPPANLNRNGAMRAGLMDAMPPPARHDRVRLAANDPPKGEGAQQKDDLLFPTEEETRAIKAHAKDAAQSHRSSGEAATRGASEGGATAGSGTQPNEPPAAPVISIAGDVDPESWAEYGGWYRQDYAIFYRPAGHKDKFVYSWLFLTGPQAPRGGKRPAAAVFDYLTSKEAQGSCTKCHSVDDVPGKGRVVNFFPVSVASKQGRFTNFIHEPHFGSLENRGRVEGNRGCLTCHNLERERPYLKSYEQGNPQTFASNFGDVRKDLCQSCHKTGMARQDCLTCHTYHVNGPLAPVMTTKLPAR